MLLRNINLFFSGVLSVFLQSAHQFGPPSKEISYFWLKFHKIQTSEVEGKPLNEV